MMIKRSRLRAQRRGKTGPNREKSLGSGLVEIGFQPIGRRIVIGGARTGEPRLTLPAPCAVCYDQSAGRIVVEFHNGSIFAVPARSLQGLVDEPEEKIAEVKLIGGALLHWERLGVDHQIALLVNGIFGTPEFTRGEQS
ncbi:hypothetical protein SRABI05_02903 [Agrobacterium fabrum]|uniref:DUF2442 domain-containing protein n=1 Tax=Agrobacterium fabrum TaxID=1176649 RepID=UPI001E0DDCB6|nr:DUF2442 domain-containing protein [Agrobacterium fabrum]CAH0247723.1 hypothetical protein SRABI46_03139 [Agrobacterium fabrum]CAH0247820.1 hypothetical protein SRABI05_02903 [Agrobacterium fabrum]